MIDLIIQDTFTFMDRIEALIKNDNFIEALDLIDEAREGLTAMLEKRQKLHDELPDSVKLENRAEV